MKHCRVNIQLDSSDTETEIAGCETGIDVATPVTEQKHVVGVCRVNN